jgi:hypothetical protein
VEAGGRPESASRKDKAEALGFCEGSFLGDCLKLLIFVVSFLPVFWFSSADLVTVLFKFGLTEAMPRRTGVSFDDLRKSCL